MAELVDRAMMESVFPAERIVRIAADKLPEGMNESARAFLTDIGLPRVRSAWFLIDVGLVESQSPTGPRLCGELAHLSRFENLPEGAESWIILGEILFDGVVLDPVSGKLYCLPDGEEEVFLLNQSLDTLGYFLYVLEVERPNYDFRKSDEIPDSEGVAAYLRELMIRADPVPFEGVEPAWSETFDWEADDAPYMPTWERVLDEVYESIG